MAANLREADRAEERDMTVQAAFSVSFDYPVLFTENIFSSLNPLLADLIARREPDRRHRCAVFVDSGLLQAMPQLMLAIPAWFACHARRVELAEPPIPVPGGEVCKNTPLLQTLLLPAMARLGLDRQSCVIVIGGGAVLDAVGFAAAVAHRGLRLVRLPSTVLAQNDAGIGVKNGINLCGQKNFAGCFAPPFAVVNDAAFLATLSERDRRAGLAEAVKVALIRDGAFLSWLEDNAPALAAFGKEATSYAIRRCAELHLRQITGGGDPFETGSARPLDCGHWAAHKLEILSDHDIRHGEAVAIGLTLDARYAVLAGVLAAGGDDRLATLLERLGFRLWHPALDGTAPGGEPALLAGLEEFRAHLGGMLTITLPTGFGTATEVHEMRPDLVVAALDWLRRRDEARASS